MDLLVVLAMKCSISTKIRKMHIMSEGRSVPGKQFESTVEYVNNGLRVAVTGSSNKDI